jgi:opacity protein-like surface antigen
MVSGSLGANFAANRVGDPDIDLSEESGFGDNGASRNYGFQLAYTGPGVVGFEFLADFSPGLNGFDNSLFEQSPDVNSYMFNLIASAPFGVAQHFDPYVSGGIGAMTLSTDVLRLNPTVNLLDVNLLDGDIDLVNLIETDSISGTKFGWDIGGGIMTWAENWGFRGDLRYFRSSSSDDNLALEDIDLNDIADGTAFAERQLSGVSFWRFNAGIAYRW